MKIGIIGTRGIPNYYGGFEQFAQYLSKYLVEKGDDVTVYSSHSHPFKLSNWEGVRIVHCFDPESKLGTIGQFIYDFNCIFHSRRENFDLILQLGYTSNSIWGWLLPKSSIILTNMDGLEWKRTKFNKFVQKFIKYAEKLAVRSSDFLIADSVGIQYYLKDTYFKPSKFIPYGAHLFEKPDLKVLDEFNLKPFTYNLLIARLEPENSIEIILDGVCASFKKSKFLVIGNNNTKFGDYLKSKFIDFDNIIFIGGIYDIDKLNNLRYFSNLYFHGHTVGGTNPSLLEAMASGALICANDNIFNKAILEKDAFYFNNSTDVMKVLNFHDKNSSLSENIVNSNYSKIKRFYDWDIINSEYRKFMNDCIINSQKNI